MAPSPTTTTKVGMRTFDDTDRAFNHNHRVQFEQLPPVKESSIESIDSTNGGAPLATFDPGDPFAALRSKSKSANNSPSASSDRSSSIKHSSQLSEPSGLQTAVQRAKFNLALKKLAGSTQGSTPKLDPSTAEFTPAAALQAPAMHTQPTSLGNTQAQNNANTGSNALQPHDGGESFDGAHPINSPGPNTLPPYLGSVLSQTSNGTPHQYTTFPAQIGGAQAQSQVTLPNYNNGMTIVNGMTPQPVRGGVNGTSGVTYVGPNGNVPAQQRMQPQLPQYANTGGMTFGVPNGNVAQYDGNNMSQTLVVRDSNLPQQHANDNNEMSCGVPNGNGAQHVNNMNGVNGANFGIEYGNVAQQCGNGAQEIPASSPQAFNGMPIARLGMAHVANGSSGNSFEQMSMSALQAHLDFGSQYPQAQSTPKHTFPQGAGRSAQYSNQSTPYQPPSNVVMQQQQSFGTPVRSGAGSPYGQSTPAPPMSVYSSPGGTATPAQYMASPSHRGRTDPRISNTRTNVSTEPPPRFDLQTPVPVHQQVYNNVISPSSAGAQLSPRGATASPGHSSSNNSVVDPFNGPALSSVIQPIEPQSAMVLHESTVPVQIRNMRSKQLNELTAGPTGRPRPEAALDAANFPFLESARNAQPTTNCGVVKLKNVSLRCFPVLCPLSTAC